MLTECRPGVKYSGIVLVSDWRESPFRNKPGTFIVLTCQDRSGQMEGKIWESDSRILNLLKEFDVFYIEGSVNEFRGNLELGIEILKPLREDEIDLDQLLPSSPFSAEELEERLGSILSLIETSELRALANQILLDSIHGQAFRKAPAAIKVHQAYRRGLWEHSVAVAEISMSIGRQYPEIDHDVMITGALFHDIGKIFEYGYERVITPTTEGRLLGHIVMGVELLSREIAQISGFPDSLRYKLLHILTSHHGRYEWQSPKRPKCMEAVIVHYADALEAELWQFRQTKKENPEEQWSPYVRSLERVLYLK